jgi:hypothetical protein
MLSILENLIVTMNVVAITLAVNVMAQTYLFNLSAYPYLPKASPQPANTFIIPFERHGSQYSPVSINKP